MTIASSATTPAARRAIWGLVNDGYALVAKTANLTADEAFELCRVPDIGDPSAYLDEGIAFLHSPKWGHVLARYYTNAERDSAGRASLVYDVVALSADAFRSLRNDAFVALPPLPPDRKPESLGELPIPELAPRDESAEMARLSSLLATEDMETLTVLLSALLEGDRVLWIAAGVRPETLECLTLLLPPILRSSLTFQVPTSDYPKHLPRLTVAERAHALLVEREWSTVLPRDVDEPRPDGARATAERLLALARSTDGERLRRAWATARPQAIGGTGLRGGVERMLRADLLLDSLRSTDLRRAVLVAARADDAAERDDHARLLLEGSGPEPLADALADVVLGGQRSAWRAAQVVAEAVAARREERPDVFAAFFGRLADRLRDVRWRTDDATASEVRVLLACAAASLDDLDLFLQLADPALPWETAWRGGTARWVKGRSTVARLFDAMSAKGATYAGSLDAVTAIAQSGGTLGSPQALGRASVLALALVRRTFAERGMLESPERLGTLVDALIRVWGLDAGASSRAATAGEDERAFRRLLGVPDASPDPRRIAVELARVLERAADGGGSDAELVAWSIAVIERAHAGTLSEASVHIVSALIDELQRAAPDADATAHIGRALLHLAATDASFIFRPAWHELARRVDPVARRDLLARALAWVARGYAAGRFTIGTLADACAGLGADDVVIDEPAVEMLRPYLSQAGVSGRTPTELGLAVALLSEIATPNAATRLADAILSGAPEHVGDRLRLRRLAAAIEEVERVRTEDACQAARVALRRQLATAGALRPDEQETLRIFLGVADGGVLGRLLGRLPGVGTGTADRAEDVGGAGRRGRVRSAAPNGEAR